MGIICHVIIFFSEDKRKNRKKNIPGKQRTGDYCLLLLLMLLYCCIYVFVCCLCLLRIARVFFSFCFVLCVYPREKKSCRRAAVSATLLLLIPPSSTLHIYNTANHPQHHITPDHTPHSTATEQGTATRRLCSATHCTSTIIQPRPQRYYL